MINVTLFSNIIEKLYMYLGCIGIIRVVCRKVNTKCRIKGYYISACYGRLP